MFNFKSIRAGVTALTAIALVGCGLDDDGSGPIAPDENPTLVDVAVANGSFGTLVTALGAADLVGTLQGDGPFTVFAPTDEAFDALPDGVLDALLADEDLLTEVLLYHVVAGSVLAADVVGLTSATTVNGADVAISVSGSDVVLSGNAPLNDANVVTTDVLADNGVIHVIDKVLLPEILFDIPQQAQDAGFSTLVTALGAADLTDVLKGAGPFTVFAPTDDAFAALGYTVTALLDNPDLLADVLKYHVVDGAVDAATVVGLTSATTLEGSDVSITVNGADVMINDAMVTVTDVETTNGIIHVIDAVLVPALNVVETAIITESTSTLAAAVAAGDLVGTLSGAGPFTVFAPVNDAFTALGMTVDELLDPDNIAILQDVLTYHVLPMDARAAALSDGLTLATVEGGDVTFTADAGSPSGFKINGANIIATDVVAENGVIHLIDGVLTESMNVVQRATVTPETQTLTAAVVAASTNGAEDLATLLSGAAGSPFTVFAPIEAAFEALGTDKLDILLDPANAEILSDILRYHVVAGAKVMAADLPGLGGSATTYDGADVTFDLSGAMPMVNGANIIATDIEVENGVIHLIDGVLTETLDIPQVATVKGFSTLVDLVVTAGLADDLSSPNGDFTVFAPTNDAFAALSAVPTGQDLIDVLLYHVLDSKVMAGDLSDGLVVTNQLLANSSFTVNISGSDVTITDGAGMTVNVVLTDVPAENGVIHVIDGVILPAP